MMSLIDLDDDQRWVPTHVNVTVLRARGLRTKGKHGSRYLYTIMQVGKEKYTTGLVEKAELPEWNEECCFELVPGILEDGGRSAYPPGSGDLVLTVMHRVLIGLDVFLGQAIVPLDKIFQEGVCPRDEWLRLRSKAGRKEKERGELQVTVQFTRNNMTASMFDLTVKDKPRSALGKLKDRVTGRKRGDAMESSSAIVPGRYAALSGALGQPFGEEGGGLGGVEVAEEKKSKVKDFFKGRLRKSSDTQSCSSLASESSMSSVASESPAPPLPSLDLLADPPSSPIYTTKVRVDSHYGEADLAKKVLTSQAQTQVLTHKRAFSDEASKITTGGPRPAAVESLRDQSMTQSQSSLCINGSHVYDSEPCAPRGVAGGAGGALSPRLVLLEKCSPLSRSLQNLARGSPGDARRWSSDKTKKEGGEGGGEEEEEEERDGEPSTPVAQSACVGGRRSAQAAPPTATSAGEPCDKERGKSLRKTLFSGGKSDSLPSKAEQSQGRFSPEGRRRGWFGSSDTQNKPRLERSPKVESSSHAPPPLPPRSPIAPQCTPPSARPAGHVSPDNGSPVCLSHDARSSCPPSPAISPSNPFLPHLQRNPFFQELLAGGSRVSPPAAPYPSPRAPPSPLWAPGPAGGAVPARATSSVRRERPRPVARQVSLPAMLTGPATSSGATAAADAASRSVSESGAAGCDDSFDAFASSRVGSPKGSHPERPLTAIPSLSHLTSSPSVSSSVIPKIDELRTYDMEPPPIPPRRLLRTPVNEIHYDSWLHRGQELAVQKEACLLSQAGAASLQHGREEHKKHPQSPSPDLQTSSETSDPLSAHSQSRSNKTSPGFMCEEKLRKFKYEPLEDDTDFWKGMLFEQDLYGRVVTGNYGEPRGNSNLPSLAVEKNFVNRLATGSLQAELAGPPKIVLDSEMSIADLLNMPSITAHKDSLVPLGTTPTVESCTISPCQPTCINNNTCQSLTLEDLNMNVNNSDFTFIDSDGSSPSEAADTVRDLKQGVFPQPSEDFLMALDHENMTTTVPLPEMNSSFDKCELSNILPAVCEAGGCEPNAEMPLNSAFTLDSESFHQANEETHYRPDTMRTVEDLKKKQASLDDNGNPQAKSATPLKKDSIPGVVSARLRPKGVAQAHGNGSLNSGNAESSFAPPAHHITHRPVIYQPAESLHLTASANSRYGDQLDRHETCEESYVSFTELEKEEANSMQSQLRENGITESSSLIEGMSFEDLHANVAPNLRTPSKSSIGPSLHDPPRPPSAPLPVPTLPPHTGARLTPAPIPCPSQHLPTSVMPSNNASPLAVGPYTSSSSTSSPPTPTAQPRVGALLPEETQPASNLPLQESSPHPVKPLTAPAGQPEKKDGRSVLEKLKSTIHPGRTAQQSTAEPERAQVTVDTSAQYQHLSNMELISLLLQQEMDMQKQRATSEQQGALLEKREAELKKVKVQVRDLEDYIDNLLLRIMEQTPTLLQVRTRHK